MPTSAGRPGTLPPPGSLATDAEVAAAVGSARGISVTAPTYGAVGDGVTDDSAAIRSAAAAAAAAETDLYFPEGTYLVSRVDAGTAYCLNHPGGRWHGPGTLKMAASQLSQTRVVHIATDGCTVDGLTIDGNSSNQGASTDQRHGLILDGATNATIRDCRLTNNDGDGLLVSDDCEGISVTRCRIDNNRRSGIALTGTLSSDVSITDCRITGNDATPIDGESNNGHIDQVRITGNYLEAASSDSYGVTFSGDSDTDALNASWTLIGNTIIGGVYLPFSTKAAIIGNSITVSGTTAGVTFTGAVGATIQGNHITQTGTVAGIYGTTSASYPDAADILITGNFVETADEGIRVQGPSHVVIADNSLSATAAGGQGIYLYPSGNDMTNITVQGNMVRNFLTYGIIVTTGAGAYSLTGCSIRGNLCSDDQGVATQTTALRLTGTAAQLVGFDYGGNINTGGTTALLSDNTTGGPVPIKAGFYNTAPIVKQTGVAVSAAGIHAALVNLGLIGA